MAGIDRAPQRAHQLSIARISIAVAILLCSSESYASQPAFIPVQCVAGQQVNFQTSTRGAPGSSLLTFDKKPDAACFTNLHGVCPHYPTAVNWQRRILANQFVSKLDYTFSMFATEANFDFLSLSSYNGSLFSESWVVGTNESGLLGAHSITTGARSGHSLQSRPDRLSFTTDSGVTAPGFALDHVNVTCGANNATIDMGLRNYERASGVLLDDGDVVFTKYTPTPGQNHTTVTLWGEVGNPAGVDFDLYARCNAPPTNAIFDARGFASGPQEMIHLDNSLCQNGSKWFIAIHAFAGNGMFNTMVSTHSADTTMDVGIGFGGPLSIPAAYWQQAQAAWYGATEGSWFVTAIRNHTGAAEPFLTDGRCGSPLVFCESMVDSAVNTGGQTRFPNGVPVAYLGLQTNVVSRIHEWGHSKLGIVDEYKRKIGENFDRPGCGYTIMTADAYSQAWNLCTSTTHKQDPDVAVGQTSVANPGINSLGGNVQFVSTPDPYNFRTLHFRPASWG